MAWSSREREPLLKEASAPTVYTGKQQNPLDQAPCVVETRDRWALLVVVWSGVFFQVRRRLSYHRLSNESQQEEVT